MRSRALRDFLIPLAILALGTALIFATGFDVAAERLFFRQNVWVGCSTFPCDIVFRFGLLPGYAMAGAGLVTFAASFSRETLARYRRPALFMVLVLILGPGLIVNVFLKDHWGRPRPAHLELFGGVEKSLYHQVWERGVSGEGRSFPSGHASMAFYLFTPYFVLRRKAKAKARLFLTLGLCYGIFMGVVRMSQGGHFASDILWAGGVVYLVGLVLAYLMRLDETPSDPGAAGKVSAG